MRKTFFRFLTELFSSSTKSENQMPARRFPPPWSVEEAAACFVVIDSAGQSSPMSISRMNAASPANIAKLPEPPA
jgi:hypothetical protein